MNRPFNEPTEPMGSSDSEPLARAECHYLSRATGNCLHQSVFRDYGTLKCVFLDKSKCSIYTPKAPPVPSLDTKYVTWLDAIDAVNEYEREHGLRASHLDNMALLYQHGFEAGSINKQAELRG